MDGRGYLEGVEVVEGNGEWWRGGIEAVIQKG